MPEKGNASTNVLSEWNDVCHVAFISEGVPIKDGILNSLYAHFTFAIMHHILKKNKKGKHHYQFIPEEWYLSSFDNNNKILPLFPKKKPPDFSFDDSQKIKYFQNKTCLF